MPKVSVILPTYFSEQYIAEAINSLLAQTLTNFELIIIDDASKDNTVSIIESYTDIRIRFYKKETNTGMAATLNQCLQLALGQYIARMDNDDIALPQRLEKQVAFMEANPQITACSTAVQMFGLSNETVVWPAPNQNLKVELLNTNLVIHPTVMMRSSHLKQYGFAYKLNYENVEDYKLWTEIMMQNTMVVLPEVLLKYRTHARQVSKQRQQLQLQLMHQVRMEYFTHFFSGLTPAQIKLYEDLILTKTPLYLATLLQTQALIKKLVSINAQTNAFDAYQLKHFLNRIFAIVLYRYFTNAAVAKSQKLKTIISPKLRVWQFFSTKKTFKIVLGILMGFNKQNPSSPPST